MGVATFDTLRFIKKLKAAGMQEKQAEVLAETLREAFDERDKALTDLEARVQELHRLSKK